MHLDEEATKLAPHCSYRVERQHDTTVIYLYGEFDLACTDSFQAAGSWSTHGLANKDSRLDLRGLSFMDSAGLHMLVALDGIARSDGFQMTLLCSDGAVSRLLAMTGLAGVLPVVDNAGVVPASESPVLLVAGWAPAVSVSIGRPFCLIRASIASRRKRRYRPSSNSVGISQLRLCS